MHHSQVYFRALYRCRMLYRGVGEAAARRGARAAAELQTGWMRLESLQRRGALEHRETDSGLSSPVRHKDNTKTHETRRGNPS